MLVSFVGFTFLLILVLNKFIGTEVYLRTATYLVLLLFGLGFITQNKRIWNAGAIFGGFFFLGAGLIAVLIAIALGLIAMRVGGKVAVKLQSLGTGIQHKAQEELGQDNPLTAFIIGLTLGLVWVPCAGPALGFAFTLVREQPGLQAFLALLTYGLGTAVPLLLIGYGGQWAVNSVRRISKYSGRIKQVAGGILFVTAFAFQFGWFKAFETWLVSTPFGNIGIELEEKFLQDYDGFP